VTGTHHQISPVVSSYSLKVSLDRHLHAEKFAPVHGVYFVEILTLFKIDLASIRAYGLSEQQIER